jgi:acetyl-CoA carboxylase carboxyltransferase component
MPFEKEMEELSKRRQKALQMGGPEKVARHHARGRLTARERIEKLLDPGTFMEVGLLNHSDMPEVADKTPADSKVGGFGKIEGRRVVVKADDNTVLAATSSRIAARKESELSYMAVTEGLPLIFLGDAGGARMPDIMGSQGLASFGGGGRDTFLHLMSRVRQTPMVSAIMGECYGMPTWMACLSDFVVQVKGTAMGVSGPRVLELAISEKITDEDLGGWKLHAEVTGMADRIAEDEMDCFQIIRRFLSYMPSHRDEVPPQAPIPEGSGADIQRILDFLPEKRNRGYDMNRILNCIIDKGSLFPIKPLFGRNLITAMARIGGKVVGIIANQPMFMGGAMDTDGLEKLMSFFCLCDTFNIPLVFFHDIPGFLVGKEAERRRVESKVMNAMNALALVTVPKISIILRKSYGQAFWNMGGSGCASDFLVAWPTAEMSFVDPEVATNVVFGGKFEGEDREAERRKYVQKMVEDASPYSAAGAHYIHDVIDPHQTRNFIIEALEIRQNSRNKGLSEHKLASWPTKF